MQKVLAIQEASAANNPYLQGKSSFKVVRQVGGQSSKRRKTERVVVPEVHTFGATEVRFFHFPRVSRLIPTDIGNPGGGTKCG
jgi:hypothetical protein